MKKSEITCKKIISQAEILFSERGVAGTSLRAIAEGVHIKAGTILHHFPGGKEQIFNELVQNIFDQLMDQLSNIEGGSADIIAAILALSSEVWDYFALNPKRAKIVMREAMEENSPAFARGKFQARLIAKAAKTIIQEGVEAGELAAIDAEVFIVSAFSHILVYHSAPALKNMIIETSISDVDKQHFLADLHARLLMSRMP